MAHDSGKSFYIRSLGGSERRQLIDTQQIYETWRAARAEKERRFGGGMRWGRRGSKDYLLRKIGKQETSLGPRSTKLEAVYSTFMEGREANADRLAQLTKRLDGMAPVNQAMGLGRMPAIAARILRECDKVGLLGEQLFIVGTNALYAYEALAGVQVTSELVATADIDLLYDARRHLSVAVKSMQDRGLIGLLQRVDQSFTPFRPRGYRAANRDGYLVDLIRPEPRDVFRDRLRSAITDLPDDLEGAPIFGLAWLVNVPKVEAVALDENGYPVRIVAIDPRAFALHKAWISKRADRERIKAARDLEQAKAAAVIAARYLQLPFDTPLLSALPVALRKLTPTILPASDETSSSDEPRW